MASNAVTEDSELSTKIVSSIIPPLDFNLHKGSAGRIGVIGGCKEYSGAPYFAAISALKVGCDLSHVFCYSDAAPVIKAYSPELIVHPVLNSADAVDKICGQLPWLHSLVIGPGLGRNHGDFEKIRVITEKAKSMELPLVFDADSLFYINSNPDLVRGYRQAVLTPNIAEFRRLTDKVLKEETPCNMEGVKRLAQTLGNVTVVLKGRCDYISDGQDDFTCAAAGSPRRCGGQGDLLSGSLGVFNYWSHQKARNSSLSFGAPVVAAFAACLLTRKCNSLAFAKYSRSMTTTDMIAEIHNAFVALF